MLATVAVALAGEEGSTFGNLTNSVNTRGGSTEVNKTVLRLRTIATAELTSRLVTPGVKIETVDEDEEIKDTASRI